MAELDAVLTEFSHSTKALTDLLQAQTPLTAVDQLIIENHLHVIFLAYSAWKRQHGLSDQGDSSARDIPVA
jgi:hypothetical protein